MTTSLLRIDKLCVRSLARSGSTIILDRASLSVEKGEVLGLAGQSGSGKTTLALAILSLLPAGLRITSGGVFYRGRNTQKLLRSELRKLRGREIGIVFQEPSAALNPVMKISTQLCEGLRFQNRLSRKRAECIAARLLEEVAIEDPRRCLKAYPHELSGGMQQRVLIAAALAGEPDLLICDEATSSLDAGVQAQVLSVLKELQKKRNLSLLYISHDLQSVYRMSDRVVFMSRGRITDNPVAESSLWKETKENSKKAGKHDCA